MKTIADWIRIVYISARREIICIFHSRLFVFLLFLLPLSLFLFFGFFYSQGLLTDLPVGVYDEDNSELSRQLTRAIESSRTMAIRMQLTNTNDLEKYLREKKLYAAFYFPAGMEKDLKKQHQVFPVFYKNSQNIVISNSLFKDASLIFKSYNAGVLLKKITASGKSASQAIAIIQPVAADIIYLYNPNFNYSNFLCPAYIFVICQIIMMFAGMFCICHEIEGKRYVRIIQSAYKFPAAILLGKYIAIIMLFGILMSAVLFIMFPFFHLYIFGPPVTVFLLTLLFLSASLLPGIAIGAILRNPFLSTEVLILLNMPSMLVSGYTFPAVPGIIASIAQVLPYLHFMPVYFKIAQMNGPMSTVFNEISVLVLFLVTGFFLAWLALILLIGKMKKTGEL